MRGADLSYVLAAVLGVAVWLCTPSAVAQTAGEHAERLFQDGRALFDQGKYDRACEKLATSDGLEPRVGTLGLLAACHEKQGRLRLARSEYLETAHRAEVSKDERGSYARDRATALEAKLGRLIVHAPGVPPSAKVFRNGEPIAINSLEFVDPGEQQIQVTGGGASYSTKTEVRAGATEVVVVPPLDAAGPERRAESPASSPRRTLGYVTAAAGLTSSAVGIGAGIFAIAKNNASDEHCDAANRCDPRGGELRDQARSAATVSTATLGAGLVGVAAGIVLVVTAPDDATHSRDSAKRVTARLVPSAIGANGGASIVGAF